MDSPILALWSLIIGVTVFGQFMNHPIDPNIEIVLENDPLIRREQAIEWSSQFFSKDQASRRSILEDLSIQDKWRFDNIDTTGTSHSLPIVKPENLLWMLQNIFTYPRSHSTNETAKEIVKKYITDSFENTKRLSTIVQYFTPTQFLEVYDGYVPTGTNIIGILKGSLWSTGNDRPIVVGAHWDTVNFTPGTDDNGSGVAAMLEIARVISSSCTPQHSIIFVAFDLEETGSQGSLTFIKDYLLSILGSNHISLKNFQGAYILDTIMNFNSTIGSQIFPTDWSLVAPFAYNEVADEKFVGDFISVIHRKEIDSHLYSKFKEHWERIQSRLNSNYKVKEISLTLGKDLPEINILADHLNLLRSDHARFWYMNDTNVPISFPAVLITDTGPYRGNMINCYHTVCDGPQLSVYNNIENLQFLVKTTQALVNVLMEMAQCSQRDTHSRTLYAKGVLRSNAVKINSFFNTLSNLIQSI